MRAHVERLYPRSPITACMDIPAEWSVTPGMRSSTSLLTGLSTMSYVAASARLGVYLLLGKHIAG